MAMDTLEAAHRPTHYDHQRYELRRRFCRFLLRTIGFNFLVWVEHVEGIENVPKTGPALLLINHISFVDPFVVLHLLPRNIVPLAKIEVYSYPVVGIFPRIYGVIPVRREEVDRRAVQQVLEVLRAGEIVLIAPEGTRSPQLSQGKDGIAYLAGRSGVPIVPVAIDGTEGFPTLRGTPRWRGPGARVCFGRPFRYRAAFQNPARGQLRQMTDEAMYVLASLLPEYRRGVYSDLSKATQDTLEWL
jgi:1-acyl-sn-glycerol-3-phosphate acyltransferase